MTGEMGVVFFCFIFISGAGAARAAERATPASSAFSPANAPGNLNEAHFLENIIRQAREKFPGVPLAAYNVSGEYSMVKAAAERG